MTGISKAKMITAIVVGAAGLIIILQNFQQVDTMVLFWRMTLPHAALLGIVFVAGFILGGALTATWLVKRWSQGRSS